MAYAIINEIQAKMVGNKFLAGISVENRCMDKDSSDFFLQ